MPCLFPRQCSHEQTSVLFDTVQVVQLHPPHHVLTNAPVAQSQHPRTHISHVRQSYPQYLTSLYFATSKQNIHLFYTVFVCLILLKTSVIPLQGLHCGSALITRLIMLRCYVSPDTKKVISETFFPVNLLA